MFWMFRRVFGVETGWLASTYSQGRSCFALARRIFFGVATTVYDWATGVTCST